MSASRLGAAACALMLIAAGCAGGAAARHGKVAAPVAAQPEDRCLHGVACETCVRCHPELAARFRAAGDWCPEHGVPESQCGICHPEVVVPPPTPPAGADVAHLVEGGRDLPSLAPHAVRGKVTIFDFYAAWCGPCRKIDEHVYALLAARHDLAYRKLDIGGWETPLARHYLARVAGLPFVIVYGKDGQPAGEVSGVALDALDRAVEVGGAR